MTSLAEKELIEMTLPLDAINKVSAREKSIRHGHSSTPHLWWRMDHLWQEIQRVTGLKEPADLEAGEAMQ